MFRIFIIVLFMIFLFPSVINAEDPIKTAFLRDGYLWTKVNGTETRISDKESSYPYPPQWS